MSDFKKLLRANIASLVPYSSARHEFDGKADILLDANESPFPSELNRYPDPLQSQLKGRIGQIYDIDASNIFIGNGSDEAIDLLIRSFCEPGEDSILVLPPTYGMYKVCADINGVSVETAPLNSEFEIDRDAISASVANGNIKLIFVCSPNNPTGNITPTEHLKWLSSIPDTLVVLDEAYAEFSSTETSLPDRIAELPNVVTLRTMSKAWGMAGARLGMAIASPGIIDILNTVKPPYNVNSLTQQAVFKALGNPEDVQKKIRVIQQERDRCFSALESLTIVDRTYPSEANFLLVKFNNAGEVFNLLRADGIIVRDRRSAVENCLRITIGTPTENDKLLATLNGIS